MGDQIDPSLAELIDGVLTEIRESMILNLSGSNSRSGMKFSAVVHFSPGYQSAVVEVPVRKPISISGDRG